MKVLNVNRVPDGAISLLHTVYRYILPEVRQRLAEWKKMANKIPNQELKKQALKSIKFKQFHCQGGAVYASLSFEQRHLLVSLIVALQTISDYLDNLCDRSTSFDPNDFRSLHQAMLDAIDPTASLHDYYAYREDRDDGGYLNQLVLTCQSCVCMLPSYHLAFPYVKRLVSLYCDLQVYKHIKWDQREEKLLTWWKQHRDQYPDLKWNEFAAATGSTLGMFMLFTAAAKEMATEQEMEQIMNAYFPYVCGLHILLDYLIDQQEDRDGGDLNFCHYYDDRETILQRMKYIAKQAKNRILGLNHMQFHDMIVDGLQGLYLSDPKVAEQKDVQWVSRGLMKNGTFRLKFLWMNCIWIRKISH